MTNNDGHSNILDIFARGSRPAEGSEDAGANTNEAEAVAQQEREPAASAAARPTHEKKNGAYRATLPAKSKREVRLRLQYVQGKKVRLLSYSHLNEILLTGHQWMSLIFTHTVVVLKGRNLDQLLDTLQDEQARALVCFRPQEHDEPDLHEPCIREMTDMALNDFMMQPVSK